ncbi:hypothetical protein [Nocardioides sp. AX2bis]|uniref:hypothetical protein n=1 Tax=Nocardioides sp. AX2bis TaxID=2653157 RepID=UPI0012F0DB6C|nr:hypothetical protein [Nocardioides sp. AX2bis]VXC58776.1 conserved hypothetical protein [Nocardioides sp. AX2bis]
MTSPTPPPPTGPTTGPTTIEVEESGWQRWALRLLPALTFVVGLGLGALVVLAGQPERDAPEPSAEPSAPASSAAGEGTADTVVTLPGACEDAAETLTEATRLIDDVAAAVRDFRPDELVGLLDRLEDLDSAARSQTAECSRVDISESASPEPAPSE